MKNLFEKTFVALLLLIALVSVSSCDESTKLQVMVAAADKECPMVLEGNTGTITSIKYEEDAVVYYWDISSTEMSLDQIKLMPNTMKKCMLMGLIDDEETLELVQDICKINKNIIYRVKSGPESYDLKLTSSEMQNAIAKGKSNKNIYPKDNENIEVALAADMNEIVNLVNIKADEEDEGATCMLEGKNLIIVIPLDSDCEVADMYDSLEEIKSTLVEEIKPNEDLTYEACAVQGYGLTFRYTDDFGGKFDINITSSEIKRKLGF